eukprot:gnl/TRDRNA2_/TRDRNA2_159477_c0_seq1.p1 gnl/TRDRNA2_/TRDRNA2_159477_c0~~gnl/TRDRNA2_/TRDRNA2_159477_c0_seq1.p1  ORF type:complete len:235 (-),score=25.72 gnl/TRDRNA2_/TRDRNA2_159477_c0_seq1:133-837(-)
MMLELKKAALPECLPADSQKRAAPGSLMDQSMPSVDADNSVLGIAKAGTAWQVTTQNVEYSEKVVGAGYFSRKVKFLANHTPYSSERIEHLLGEMPDMNLEDMCRAPQELATDRIEESTDSVSSCSSSTLLFGSSDVANIEDIGDPDGMFSDQASPVSPWSPKSPLSPTSPIIQAIFTEPQSPCDFSPPSRSSASDVSSNKSCNSNPCPSAVQRSNLLARRRLGASLQIRFRTN